MIYSTPRTLDINVLIYVYGERYIASQLSRPKAENYAHAQRSTPCNSLVNRKETSFVV